MIERKEALKRIRKVLLRELRMEATSHIQKAYTKAGEVNQKYTDLKTTFEQITETKQ